MGEVVCVSQRMFQQKKPKILLVFCFGIGQRFACHEYCDVAMEAIPFGYWYDTTTGSNELEIDFLAKSIKAGEYQEAWFFGEIMDQYTKRLAAVLSSHKVPIRNSTLGHSPARITLQQYVSS